MMRKFNNRIIFCLLFVIFAIFIITKKESLPLEPLYEIPYFSYNDQNTNSFTVNNLKNKISIVDFFFTSCQGPCPAMNRYMSYLVDEFSEYSDIQFVSFSVDPHVDSSSHIKDYLDRMGLNYSNWYFLETEEPSIKRLLEDGFKFSADGLPGMHSTKFILVDSNAFIRGYYDPFLNEDFEKLEEHALYLLENI